MNTKIFKNFVSKRDLKYSKFDMSFKNLGTSNFGALQVKGVLPVMPGDDWSIGVDSLTKVDPMSAPPFTRIMQNTYAYYVPNPCIWSHWNDFISNGTAFLDTYGNNATNQELKDSWRVPTIPVIDLMHIAKIAKGWSIPVWNLSSEVELINTYLQPLIDKVLSYGIYYLNQSSSIIAHILFWKMLQGFASRFSLGHEIKALFSCALVYPTFVFEFQNVQGSNLRKIVSCRLSHITVGCSYDYLLDVLRLLGSLTVPGSTSYSDMIVSSSDVQYTDVKFRYTNLPIEFLHFCDPTARPGSESPAPFALRRGSCTVKNFDVVNTYNYFENLTDVDDYVSDASPVLYYSSKSGLYGKSMSVDISKQANGKLADYPVNLYNVFYLPLSIFNDSGFEIFDVNTRIDVVKQTVKSYFDIFPHILYYFLLENDYVKCFAAYGNEQRTSDFANWEDFPFISNTQTDPVALGLPAFFPRAKGSYCKAFERNYVTERLTSRLDLHTEISIDTGYTYPRPYNDMYFIPWDPESLTCGYSTFGFLIYLCQQATQNLEKFNIPIDTFVNGNFWDYLSETIDCLPFFAYSKIYNDYYRNKAVTTAELDFCKTNSVAFWDASRILLVETLQHQTYATDGGYLQKQNGWVIPFETLPKNSLGERELTLGTTADGVSLIEESLRNFHYFDIYNFQSLFSVLTGCQLKYDVMYRLMNLVRDYGDGNKKALFNLFLNGVYLPSYYNGLLHQKYQNFNQDYFSSALLDPMSGANNVAVPDTITELRSAERTQTFWERLAMNRSFQSFSEKVFGVKPFHDDVDKPLMLGSMHTRLQIGEVVQTSETTASSTQGTRTGLGAGHGNSGLVSRRFSEYGYIIILQSHTVEVQYFQGLEKHWTPKQSFLDYPFFDFVAIGNQPIQERELNYGVNPIVNLVRPYADVQVAAPFSPGFPKGRFGGFNSPAYVANQRQNFLQFLPNVCSSLPSVFHDSVFGYTSRFSEWKFKFDELHGEFRNNLKNWHTFREFFIRPVLTHEFVSWEFMADDNELNRLFNVIENEISDKFKVYLKFNASVRRALPFVCQPSM